MLYTSAGLTIQVKIISQSFSPYAWKGTLDSSNHNFSNSVFETHTLDGVLIPQIIELVWMKIFPEFWKFALLEKGMKAD